MDKKFDNAEKKEYRPPVLVKYGTINSLTHAASDKVNDGGGLGASTG